MIHRTRQMKRSLEEILFALKDRLKWIKFNNE